MALPAGLFLLFMLAGCIHHAALPPALPPLAAPTQPAERIPISIRTSWPGLLAAAEAAIPRCTTADADGACPDSAGGASFILRQEGEWHPIDRRILGQQLGVKGSVWRRDPIVASIAGTHFTASLRLQYQVRIGNVGGAQLASCGVGEPPREITVYLDGDLRFAPEWYIDPTFKVEILPESRCRATFMNFDITDALTGPIQEALEAEAADAARRIREISNVRDRAAAVWASLNQPIAVGSNLWFAFNLSGAHVRPPQITPDGRYVLMKLALDGTPKVTFGARPPTASTALPALSLGDTSPKFDIRVRGLVTYAKASAILIDHLKGPSGTIQPARVSHHRRVSDRERSQRGRLGRCRRPSIRHILSLRGAALRAKERQFSGRRSSAQGRGLHGQDQQPVTRLGVSLFRARIQRALAGAAWWDVSPELQAAAAQFGGVLNRDLSSQASLRGKLTRFGPGEVRIGPEGLEAWYQLGGKVEVVVTPFD